MALKVVFSSDIAGLTGSPKDLVAVYKELFTDVGNPLLVEVVAWRHQVSSFLKGARKYGYQVAGIHGPISISKNLFKGLKAKAIDWLMVDLKGLLSYQYDVEEGYLLLHENVIDDFPERKNDLVEVSRKQLVMIENTSVVNSLGRTINKAEYLKNMGGKIGVMVDLVHLLKEYQGYEYNLNYKEFRFYWKKALRKIKDSLLLEKFEIIGFHVPIGIRVDDNLPFGIMDKILWEDFSGLVRKNKNVKFLVIENQRRLQDQFLPPSWLGLESIKKRNHYIFSQLKSWGVIDNCS